MAGKHEKIAGSLIQDILSGRYRVEERLPSERDLASRFDANRGAVREAMKKLEQIGLAEIQPGGARVKDMHEASLDVLGHLLTHDHLPDPLLIDQILVVINSLMRLATEQTLELASDQEIEHIRTLAKPLYAEDLDEASHTLARIELFQSIMLTNRNLPLQLISRTLFDQFARSLGALNEVMMIDKEAYGVFAKQLDQALAKRDVPAVQATFSALSDLHRQTMMHAFEAARSNLSREAVTS